MTTDLGLDWLASADLFGFAVCVLLFYVGVRMKSFPFCVVPAVGTILVGLRIFQASEDPFLFLVMFAMSAAMTLYGAKFKGW